MRNSTAIFVAPPCYQCDILWHCVEALVELQFCKPRPTWTLPAISLIHGPDPSVTALSPLGNALVLRWI